ncbi:helix-turn-helix domain-containing protein [Candidatus Daviesbacteria bacterium]|nr:helix-turn-helix domain-containing protein [Candidatus Daviesbacteria bacterium]MBI2596726.1 helix-turn-helix domain-containing protein [Candidatus Daviesbacteria bacterium]
MEEEILDLAQRLKIAKLILEEKTYDEIAEKVGTSTSTVSKKVDYKKYCEARYIQKAVDISAF